VRSSQSRFSSYSIVIHLSHFSILWILKHHDRRGVISSFTTEANKLRVPNLLQLRRFIHFVRLVSPPESTMLGLVCPTAPKQRVRVTPPLTRSNNYLDLQRFSFPNHGDGSSYYTMAQCSYAPHILLAWLPRLPTAPKQRVRALTRSNRSRLLFPLLLLWLHALLLRALCLRALLRALSSVRSSVLCPCFAFLQHIDPHL
jgi:hypothetical protein